MEGIRRIVLMTGRVKKIAMAAGIGEREFEEMDDGQLDAVTDEIIEIITERIVEEVE